MMGDVIPSTNFQSIQHASRDQLGTLRFIHIFAFHYIIRYTTDRTAFIKCTTIDSINMLFFICTDELISTKVFRSGCRYMVYTVSHYGGVRSMTVISFIYDLSFWD